MSTKPSSQQARRTPLSLTGGGVKHQQQQPNKASENLIGSSKTNVAPKNEVKNDNQIVEQDLKKQQISEKKQNSGDLAKATEKVEEKKTQNGLGKGNGVSKEKHQNGSELNNAANSSEKVATNKDKVENLIKESLKNKEEKVVQSNDKKEKETEKRVEKETRTKRSDAIALDVDKKKTEKFEADIKTSDVYTEVALPPSKPGTPQSNRSNTTTPTKAVEKTPAVGNTSKASEKSATLQKNKINTVINDDTGMEMEPIVVDTSPAKPQKYTTPAVAVVNVNPKPAVTSTPGKTITAKKQQTALKSEIQLATKDTGSPDRNNCPRNFLQISGRRSIRPLSEYSSPRFQSNTQYRESYRRINTELDISSTTNNTSLNVTVGSERPSLSSFSFFGRRKRDRTPPPQSQSTIELQTDPDYSPPKRARLDMHGFFSAVASPLTLLRSRFSKTSIQSSTPVKLSSKEEMEDEGVVQNVSGISIEEELPTGENEEKTDAEDVTMGKKLEDISNKEKDSSKKENDLENDVIVTDEKTDDISMSETPDVAAAGVADTSAKSKRCSVM